MIHLFFCTDTHKSSRQPSCESGVQLSALEQSDMPSSPVSQSTQSASEISDLVAILLDTGDDEGLESMPPFQDQPNSLNLVESEPTQSALLPAASVDVTTVKNLLAHLLRSSEHSLIVSHPASSDAMVPPMDLPDIKEIVEEEFSNQLPALQPQSALDELFPPMEEGDEMV